MLRVSSYLFRKIEEGYSSSGYKRVELLSETNPLAPAGRGNAGTAAFFKKAMAENVRRIIEEGKKNEGKRGCEIEADEWKRRNQGKDSSSH